MSKTMDDTNRAALKLAMACRSAARPPMTQVAPGVYVPAGKRIPGEVMGRFIEEEDGRYRFVPIFEELVRVDKRVLKLIGMENQINTLKRLIRSGMVEGIKVAPGTTLLNLASWCNHVARCAEDPDLWERGRGYLEEYRKSL